MSPNPGPGRPWSPDDVQAAWTSLLHRRARLLLSVLAIVLGWPFILGSFIFTNMLSVSLNVILRGTVADVNVDPVGTYTSGGSAFGTDASTIGRVLLTPPSCRGSAVSRE
ncbi:MAG: hypothetical protein M0Z51_03720 [Propionibacterium sp.]|nr:hypothetical protein [Propionibacterium sp.]